MAIFDTIKKLTKNEYAFELGEENPYEVREWIDTGCYALNAILSDGDIFKGIPDGKRIMLAGASGTAKSLFTSYLIKSYLDNKINSKAIFFESEGSTTVDMAKNVGINDNQMIILPIMTIEEMRTQMVRIIDEIIEDRKKITSNNLKKKDDYEKKLKKAKKEESESVTITEPIYEEYENFIFILDSLGMLGSLKETTDISEAHYVKDMTKSQLLRGFARTVSLKLSLIQSPFIIVNHTYQTFDKYNPEVVSGGGGPIYMADVVLVLKKIKAKDEESKEQIGVEIRCKVEKSRFMKENKIVKILLSFKHGIFKYSYLTQLSQELDLFKKDGFSYILPDNNKVKMKEMRIPKLSIEYFNQDVMNEIRNVIKKDFEFGDN